MRELLIGIAVYLGINMYITCSIMADKDFAAAYKEAEVKFSKAVVAITLLLFGLPALVYALVVPDEE